MLQPRQTLCFKKPSFSKTDPCLADSAAAAAGGNFTRDWASVRAGFMPDSAMPSRD